MPVNRHSDSWSLILGIIHSANHFTQCLDTELGMVMNKQQPLSSCSSEAGGAGWQLRWRGTTALEENGRGQGGWGSVGLEGSPDVWEWPEVQLEWQEGSQAFWILCRGKQGDQWRLIDSGVDFRKNALLCGDWIGRNLDLCLQRWKKIGPWPSRS